MTDRFIRITDVAAMLGTTPDVAASIMAAHHVYPVNLGYGRGRGRRWLESAVRQVVLDMHQGAQPKTKPPKSPRPQSPRATLAGMSPAEIFNLTQSQIVQ